MSILKNFSFNNFAQQGAAALPGRGFWPRWLDARVRRRTFADGLLEHLATVPLNTQASLVLVRLGGETLLLGATAQGIHLLTKQPASAPDGESAGLQFDDKARA